MSTRTTRAAAKTAEKAATDVTNVMQDATAKVETFVADAQKNATEQFEKFSKGLEGLTTFGQENVDAHREVVRDRRQGRRGHRHRDQRLLEEGLRGRRRRRAGLRRREDR